MYSYKYYNVAFLIDTVDIINSRLKLKVEDAILDVFKGFLKSDSSNIQFAFRITDNIDRFITDTEFIRFKNVQVGKDQIYFRDNELSFLINKSDPFNVVVNIDEDQSITSSFRIFNKAFNNNIEKQIVTFYYRVFLLFSQLWNVQNGLSYIHSSAISVAGESILFTASSGIGKSSLLLNFSQLAKFDFIADDLTIISSESKSFYQGRSLSIKPYHLEHYPFLIDKLRSLMSIWQKLQWKIIDDNRLTYRICPLNLFNKVAESSDIRRVFHLCNHSDSDYRISDLSVDDFIKYNLSILSNEFFLANYKINTLASLPDSPFPNTYSLYKEVKDIYLKAFESTEIKLVLIPYRSNPNDLYSFLNSEGCLA